MADIFIDESSLGELKEIFKRLCPNALVWAYGSRIDGSAHSGSDLDLAIVDYGQRDVDYMELKEALKDSKIPFLIDICELGRLPESFQGEIKRKHVVLYDGQSGGSFDRARGAAL